MERNILFGVGVFAILNAALIWGATELWYDRTPGVSQTGPLNLHFARDVGLAFLCSGLTLIFAAYRGDKSIGVCGAAWLVSHAVFHIWIWIARGMQLDLVALTNVLGIQVPAALALWAALSLPTGEGQE